MPKISTDLDMSMMTRCLELSRESVAAGELPFACVICHDGEVLAESTNRVRRDRDMTLHALLQRRALRDVLLLHSRDPHTQGGLRDPLADHGRTFEMENPARPA